MGWYVGIPCVTDEIKFRHLRSYTCLFLLFCIAIRFAIRRHPNFRFDYFLRSLPVDQLGKRCEQLMRAAEKEVEAFERQVREAKGLPTESEEGKELEPIVLPKYNELQRTAVLAKKAKVASERKGYEDKVHELEGQISELQNRLKELSSTGSQALDRAKGSRKVSPEYTEMPEDEETKGKEIASQTKEPGAIGGDGDFQPFPDYNGVEAPQEWRKPFAHFCNQKRKDVKKALDPEEKKDKKMVNQILKDKWMQMSEEEKDVYRGWCEWDKKRYAHEKDIFDHKSTGTNASEEDPAIADDGTSEIHAKKKRRQVSTEGATKRQRT